MNKIAVTFLAASCLLAVLTVAGQTSASLLWFNASQDKNLLVNIEHVLRKNEISLEEDDGGDTQINSNLASYFQSVIPPFVIKNTKNQKCVRDSAIFQKNLNSLALWAVTMYDSAAKIPSSLLSGNVNQFGDFNRCLKIHDSESNIRGKYCLAYIQLHLPKDRPVPNSILQIYNLVHSHRVFKSTLNDSGHRVPRYSTVNWALCVPSSCTSEDVQMQLKESLNEFANTSALEVEVRVEPGMCQVQKPSSFSWQFKIVASLLSSIVIIALAGSYVELSSEKSLLKDVLNCFSLKKNCSQLFSFKRDSNDIATVHGIRMLNSIMLLLSHKSMAMFFSPYSNRTSMNEELSQQWTVLARAAALYTDPFIMMSGMLTTLSYIRSFKKTGTIDVKKEYINRLTRMVPSMAAIILVCTFLLPELGSGPQWDLTVNHHAEKCKKYWWRNFLFIHNYFGFNNMCLTHTHHIGIDMELFFISPLLVWIVHKWKMHGIAVLVGLAAFSTGLRYYTTFTMKLSYFIYPGISNLQMIQTADYSYSIPLHRLSMYIMGVILAYVMDYCSKDYKLKPNVRRLGWMISVYLFYYSYIKPSAMGVLGYEYNEYDAANYAALCPIAWCLMFAWIIFMDHIGYNNIMGDIFSQKFGPIWTRMSYAIYLTQFPIYFYNVGMQKSSVEYAFISFMNFWEFSVIFIASAALSLFVEYPFNNIRRTFFNR